MMLAWVDTPSAAPEFLVSFGVGESRRGLISTLGAMAIQLPQQSEQMLQQRFSIRLKDGAVKAFAPRVLGTAPDNGGSESEPQQSRRACKTGEKGRS